MNVGVGWYILGQDQQLLGPYTVAELQGESLCCHIEEGKLNSYDILVFPFGLNC